MESTAERICVGDIIVLSEDDVVPCDAVILSTSNDSHQVRKSGSTQHNCMSITSLIPVKYLLSAAIYLGLRNDSKLRWRDEPENKVCCENYSRVEDC